VPHNKELKLTKPSVLELRSLTPVFDGRTEAMAGTVAGYRGRGGVVKDCDDH
jgi:hypothetical protein